MSIPPRPQVQVPVHIRPVFKEFAHNFVPGPGCGWYARFYQAEPAPVVGTTKCPESLGLMSALDYRLLRGHYSSFIAPTDSCVNSMRLSSTSAFDLVRGVFAGCYQPLLLPGFSRRYLCESLPEPMPRRFAEGVCRSFPSIHRPSPSFDCVGFPLPSVNTTFHGSAFEAAAISLCSCLQVCSPPRSFLPLQVSPQRSRKAFTSEQNVRCYPRTHRTCFPPDNRQLDQWRRIGCPCGHSRQRRLAGSAEGRSL